MERSGNGRRSGRRNGGGRHSQDEGRKRSDRRGKGRGQDSRHRVQARLPQQVHEEMQRDLEAIKELKEREVLCVKCEKRIEELSSALADRASGMPIHFDCALEELQQRERLGENQQITYIGQGRFAVVSFPDARDTKKFSIVRIIEWESRDTKFDWRQEIASMYSQIH